jgi:hypothetical protein
VAKREGYQKNKSTNLRYISDIKIANIGRSSLKSLDIYHIWFLNGMKMDIHVFGLGKKIPEEYPKEIYRKENMEKYKMKHLSCSGRKPIINREPDKRAIKNINNFFWSTSHRFSKMVFRKNLITLYMQMNYFTKYFLRMVTMEDVGKDIMSEGFRASSHAVSEVASRLSKHKREEVIGVLGKEFSSRESALHSLREMNSVFEEAVMIVADRYDIRLDGRMKKVAKERWKRVAEDVKDGHISNKGGAEEETSSTN